MTKDELADRLNRLDPGSTAEVDAGTLAEMFGASALTQEVVEAIEAFALDHRCSFLYRPSAHQPPVFEKDDIY